MFKLTPNATALFNIAQIDETNQVTLTFAYKNNDIARQIAALPMVYAFTPVYAYDESGDELVSNPEKEFTFRVNAGWDTAAIVVYVEKELTKFFDAKKVKQDKKAAEEQLRADYLASLEALRAADAE